MKAYKCDVCGKLYVPYNTRGDTGTNVLVQAVNNINVSGRRAIKEYDLCQECCKSFNDWLDSRKGINECEEEEEE